MSDLSGLIALGWLLGFATMIITLPTLFVYSLKIANLLKLKHPEVWVSLGKPIPFRNSIRTSLVFNQFVKNPNAYVKDDEISNLANKIRILKKIHLSAFFVLIACSVLFGVLEHRKNQ